MAYTGDPGGRIPLSLVTRLKILACSPLSPGPIRVSSIFECLSEGETRDGRFFKLLTNSFKIFTPNDQISVNMAVSLFFFFNIFIASFFLYFCLSLIHSFFFIDSFFLALFLSFFHSFIGFRCFFILRNRINSIF